MFKKHILVLPLSMLFIYSKTFLFIIIIIFIFQWKIYEWSKCIPAIKASFPNANMINVEWRLPYDAKLELIDGYYVSYFDKNDFVLCMKTSE